MVQLADRLGVTQALLYRYFPSKQRLIERVLEHTFGRLRARAADPALRDRGRPLEARLIEFYQGYLARISFTSMRLFVRAGADVRTIFNRPLHEYTKALIASVPKVEEDVEQLAQLDGQPPLLHDLPPGDAFAPRSTLQFRPEDAMIRPKLVEVEPGHWVQLGRASVADFDRYAHLVDYG